jgi:hypothetical protein
MRLDENAIYRTRGGSEVGLVLFRLITGDRRFNVLVEYQPANGRHIYAESQFELVDWRGYVFGADTPHHRDLIQFIEYNEETYYQ